MKKRELIFFAALATFLSANAQEKQIWSLEDCINYALEKNIQLQQNKISLGKRSGCKDSKGCTLSKPLVQHRTQHCESSLSGKQRHSQWY